MTDAGRQWLAAQALPATAREQITVGVAMIEALDLQLAPIDKQLRAYARRQPGCRVLMGQFGVGEMTAVTILAELGDARRFSSSRDAARYAGLDVTVHQSDCRRAPSIRRERELARFRSHLVRHRTTLKNRIHAT
jgi:transposase